MNFCSVKNISGILIWLFLGSLTAKSTQVEDYIEEFRTTGVSDFHLEKTIVSACKSDLLIDNLRPYYRDSLTTIRRKAYYLTYKKGIHPDTKNRKKLVNKLTDGIFDKNGGIIGENLSFLKEFDQSDFSRYAKDNLEKLLRRKKVPHYKELTLLAGYVGCGKEYMNQKLAEESVSNEIKWAYSLALARQGDKERLNYCLDNVKKVSPGNNLATHLVPVLIYTHQKEALDYCAGLLNSDEKLCHSADPDNSEYILCGYYIMELLAPVIKDFPLETDETGMIITGNYEKALAEVRKWFKTNPDYKIINNKY